MFGRNDDGDWVAAPTDVVGAGAYAYEQVIGVQGQTARQSVGGGSWTDLLHADGSMRVLANGDSMAPVNTDAHTTAMLDDWRDLFNWRHSPAPWIALALLVAVGFVHLRVNTKAGPYHGNFGLG